MIGVILALACAFISFILLPYPAWLFHAFLAFPALHIAYTDLRTYRVPLYSIAAIGLLGIAWTAHVTLQSIAWHRNEMSPALLDLEIVIGFLRAFMVAAFFVILNYAYRWLRGVSGIASGDIMIFATAGLWLPLTVFPEFILVASVGAIVLIAFRRLAKGRMLDWQSRVPFGAFLAISLWLCTLATLGSMSP